MVVTLIGYRGSGKSTVAAPLAERLGWSYRDADDEIEHRAGKSIREIFDDDGEPAFRQWERQVLANLLAQSKLVIAAGGGAILSEETRNLMKTAGPVIWLQASVDVLQQRITADDTTTERRPKLTVDGGRTEIERVLTEREPLYRECASISIETDGLAADDIVDRVFSAIENDVCGGSHS